MTTERKSICGNRKQITFDLSQKALAEHYPRPILTINPKFYEKAYSDISRFMKKNEFEHWQFSVYTSTEKLTEAKVISLIDELAFQMPWLTLCVTQIDVTNIGSQHSLLQTLEAATALQVEPSQLEKKTDRTTAEPAAQAKMSMKERFAVAQAEADLRNSSHAPQQSGKDHSSPEK